MLSALEILPETMSPPASLPTPVSMSIVETVRQSYARCRKNPDFFDAFYDHFARKSSEIGPMFSDTDMQRQNDLLSDAITSLISFATQDAEAIEHINQIGLSHDRQHMDIKVEWYPLWIEALRDTIQESDPEYTPQLLEDWETVIQPGINQIVALH